MKVLYVDMDNVLVDFVSGLNQIESAVQEEYADRADEIPGIFALMSPMEGAIESFNSLSKIFDTYLLSTAPWMNPSAWSDKLYWVKEHLGDSAYKRLILTHHKNLNRGDFLVDDRTKNGADRFEGQFIHFGTDEYPNWHTVTDYLRGRA